MISNYKAACHYNQSEYLETMEQDPLHVATLRST